MGHQNTFVKFKCKNIKMTACPEKKNSHFSPEKGLKCVILVIIGQNLRQKCFNDK